MPLYDVKADTFVLWLLNFRPELKETSNTLWTALHSVAEVDRLDVGRSICSQCAVDPHHVLGDTDFTRELLSSDASLRALEQRWSLLKSRRPRHPTRCLFVLVNVVRFSDSALDRSGAEQDSALMSEVLSGFEGDLMVLDTSQSLISTDDLARFRKGVQLRMRREKFDALFFVLSSHGGINASNEEYFFDSFNQPLHLERDWMHHFSVDHLPEMHDKMAIFVPTFCRSFLNSHSTSHTKSLHEQVVVFDQGAFLRVEASQKGHVAHRLNGSLCLRSILMALKKALDNKRDTNHQGCSVRMALNEAKAKTAVIGQSMGVNDHLIHDLLLTPKASEESQTLQRIPYTFSLLLKTILLLHLTWTILNTLLDTYLYHYFKLM